MAVIEVQREWPTVTGNVRILARQPAKTDDWELIRSGKNLVVNDGRDVVADMIGGTGRPPSHIGIGTGVSTVVAADDQIEVERYRDLITRRDKLVFGTELQLFVPQGSANGFTYTEAGVLVTGLQHANPGDPATLFARFTYTGIAKTSSIELTYLWQFNITAS